MHFTDIILARRPLNVNEVNLGKHLADYMAEIYVVLFPNSLMHLHEDIDVRPIQLIQYNVNTQFFSLLYQDFPVCNNAYLIQFCFI
jgi:hypothetical protein